jgi:hypothetical protein
MMASSPFSRAIDRHRLFKALLRCERPEQPDHRDVARYNDLTDIGGVVVGLQARFGLNGSDVRAESASRPTALTRVGIYQIGREEVANKVGIVGVEGSRPPAALLLATMMSAVTP